MTAARTRLLAKTRREPLSGCLIWLGATKEKGYGAIRVGMRTVRAHRFAWELAHGPIPAGAWVLHRCDRPECVAVEHLYVGGAAENTRDMMERGRDWGSSKTRCVRGHPLSGANLRRMRGANGRTWRQCRTCDRLRQQQQQQRRSKAAD